MGEKIKYKGEEKILNKEGHRWSCEEERHIR